MFARGPKGPHLSQPPMRGSEFGLRWQSGAATPLWRVFNVSKLPLIPSKRLTFSIEGDSASRMRRRHFVLPPQSK